MGSFTCYQQGFVTLYVALPDFLQLNCQKTLQANHLILNK